MAKRPRHIKKDSRFPRATKKNNEITSDETPQYNCIAFAAGITTRKYWPSFHPDYYWPQNIRKTIDLDAFIELYASIGYSVVEDGGNGKHVAGHEKIAIYTRNWLMPRAQSYEERISRVGAKTTILTKMLAMQPYCFNWLTQ